MPCQEPCPGWTRTAGRTVLECNPRAILRAFLTTRRATLARLQRVNKALSGWDEYEAA